MNRTMYSGVLCHTLTLRVLEWEPPWVSAATPHVTLLASPLDSPPIGGIVPWLKAGKKSRTQIGWAQIPALPLIGGVALGALLQLCLP